MTETVKSHREGSGDASLMPHPRLSIGVTGHRPDRLGEERLAAVAGALSAVLMRIEDAVRAVAPVELRLVTSLAEGADSMAADAAIARGWALDVVLPFPREEYRRDFPVQPGRHDYGVQLDAAAAVMELPGHRDEPDGMAYERAGRVMMAQCDILVAVWDGGPARGRGGAAQIVAEAVLHGIPVIRIDPNAAAPTLLWERLQAFDLGRQTVETVAHGDLSALPGLIRSLVEPPSEAGNAAMLARFERPAVRRWTIAIAYPLLLAVMGVRPLRRTDVRDIDETATAAEPVAALCTSEGPFATALRALLPPRFAQADRIATRAAQRFRSIYVFNFTLAAIAVVVSLSSLALDGKVKPFLLAFEFALIAAILLQTRAGNRAAWHRLWLDNRALAERLRCLAISAQLGMLELRSGSDRLPPWVRWYARGTARQIGLPAARIDGEYVACVRRDLLRLIDGQTAYLAADAKRMHDLEHRLHLLGTILFAATAVTCIVMLIVKLATKGDVELEHAVHGMSIAATIVGAALPAIGAAIYGIRTQGDFAGIAGRNHALGEHLKILARVIAEDPLDFDILSRRARRATDLLTEDLATWLQTYDARPLALPG